ncbi:MAG: relaxase/mobilization nuclease domain-containing protein [Ruminococcus sp.]|nr:relaxase/mobilization nuclease domain-containing protein [Ruminococcus sp.]
MAINKTINKRTNTHGAMRNCIEYVLRQDKTSELLTYVTGPYCHDEINYDLVYRTFLEEKKMWDKDSGRMYAHNIISWHKDEQITPEQAFEFGKQFAETWFSGFQTLVAVHKDKDHIHCHLVTNSVSYEDGRKLHNTKKDLERMKQLTNQMCRERGLTVAEKGKHFGQFCSGLCNGGIKGTGKLYQQRKVYRKNETVWMECKLDRETEAHYFSESGWKESARQQSVKNISSGYQ